MGLGGLDMVEALGYIITAFCWVSSVELSEGARRDHLYDSRNDWAHLYDHKKLSAIPDRLLSGLWIS